MAYLITRPINGLSPHCNGNALPTAKKGFPQCHLVDLSVTYIFNTSLSDLLLDQCC